MQLMCNQAPQSLITRSVQFQDLTQTRINPSKYTNLLYRTLREVKAGLQNPRLITQSNTYPQDTNLQHMQKEQQSQTPLDSRQTKSSRYWHHRASSLNLSSASLRLSQKEGPNPRLGWECVWGGVCGCMHGSCLFFVSRDRGIFIVYKHN